MEVARRSGRQGQQRGLAPEDTAQAVEGTLALLPAGAPHGHEHRLRSGAGPGAVAAPKLAENHAEAHGVFGLPVGGVEAVHM